MEYTPLIEDDDEPKPLKDIRFSSYRALHAVCIIFLVLSLPWVIFRFGGSPDDSNAILTKRALVVPLSEESVVSKTNSINGRWEADWGDCIILNNINDNNHNIDDVDDAECEGERTTTHIKCVVDLKKHPEVHVAQIDERFCAENKPEYRTERCTMPCPSDENHKIRRSRMI